MVRRAFGWLLCQLGCHDWYYFHVQQSFGRVRFVDEPNEDTFTARFCWRCKAPVSKLPHRRNVIKDESLGR